jgi:hypothetical protein
MHGAKNKVTSRSHLRRAKNASIVGSLMPRQVTKSVTSIEFSLSSRAGGRHVFLFVPEKYERGRYGRVFLRVRVVVRQWVGG